MHNMCFTLLVKKFQRRAKFLPEVRKICLSRTEFLKRKCQSASQQVSLFSDELLGSASVFVPTNMQGLGSVCKVGGARAIFSSLFSMYLTS